MPLRVSSARPGVVWHGSFFVNHSLALVNRELVLALLQGGRFDVGIRHLEPPDEALAASERFAPLALRMRALPDSPFATVRHGWPPDWSRPGTGRFVVVQPWEFGSLPNDWVAGIAAGVDEVWVPSNFVRDCYVDSGVAADRVFVVPNGVNLERFHPGVEPVALPTERSFKFLFVGGTIARKGVDLLLQAYGRAFTSADDVSLVIKDFGSSSFYAGQGAAALIADLQGRPGAPEVVHMDRDLSEAELAGWYAACDALVHPYRGEGYGLPIAEAMACGKPAILTGAGAALDFANTGNSILVPAKRATMSERRIGDMATVDLPWWYEPDVDALATAMRDLYEDPHRGRELGARAARDIAERHTWAHSAAIAAERLEALAQVRPSAPSATVRMEECGPLLTTDFETRKAEAIALTRAGEWDLAREELDRCLAEQPDDGDLVNALGVTLFRTGDVDGAVSLLRRGLERASDTRDLHHNLAFVLVECGEGVSALAHACAALEQTPDSPEIRRTVERARQAAVRDLRRIRKRGADGGAAARRDPRYQSLSASIARADALLADAAGSQGVELASGQRTARQRPSGRRNLALGTRNSEVCAPISAARKTPRLSVVMIAKNEERFLRECLESVRVAADEIVLVDTGSTDATVAIAEEFGARVLHHAWTDDFSAARNVALDHATGDWALWLDADERLKSGDAELLRYLIAEAELRVGGYMVNIRNFMQLRPDAEVCWHRACRLFRIEPRIRFTGRIHEQNMRSLQEAGYVCAMSQLALDHLGYASEVMDERNKHERFIRMLTREVEDNPDETYRSFHLFNLANAYFTRGDMHAAIPWFERAGESPDPAQEYTAIMYVEWATALYAVGRATDALDVCVRAEAVGIRHPSLEFARGHALLHRKEYADAERAFRAALQQGRDGRFVHTGDTGAYTYKAWYGLALALTGQEDWTGAVDCCRESLAQNATFVDARYLLAKALRHLGHNAEARPELEWLIEKRPGDVQLLSDLGCACFEVEDYAAALSTLRRCTAAGSESVEVWSRLGLCCEGFGLFEEARTAFLSARRLAPASPELLVNLGRTYSALGQDSVAIDLFTDAIQIDSTYANAYFNAADVLYRLGYYLKAAETVEAGLQRDPSRAEGFFVLGNCYFQLRDYTAAVASYQAAMERRSDYSEARSNLALAMELASGPAAATV